MKKKKDSKSLTRLLSDNVPEKDAFGGHEKVARAIYELIYEEKEGGKAIALSGSFGSGKSTVIEFLKRKFYQEEKDSEKDTGIFIFDAWEHQGNPLRRAFIEEYIDFLRNDVGWANKKEYKELLELVSKNREDINTTTEPYLTPLGGWFALLLLMVPLALGLFRAGMMENSHWALYWVGLLLLGSPLLYIIGVYLCWRPYTSKQKNRLKRRLNLKKIDIKDFFSKNRTPYHRKSIFNFFGKKSREKIKSTSLKSPDPTTIEFQDVFNTITSEVLANKNRRLIIVIDNIDRLTTKSSINAWTTLRTFFENDNKDWEWKDQFWLIAPFDLQELKKLWSGLDHLGNFDKNGSSEQTSEYVQAFIDKTFQVLFRVPQPVLSDWKDYFIQQLRFAFPNVVKQDQDIFNNIATLYQIKRVKQNESPTPRDIKQFINRVVAHYRIWHKSINLPVLAYYELVANVEEEEMVQALKKGDLIDSTANSLIAEDNLNKKLAAIHFNCEIDKATQVLFGDLISKAMHEGEAESLKDYFETDGFLDVLRSEFYSVKNNDTVLGLAKCTLCLNEIEENSQHILYPYYEDLAKSFMNITSLKPFTEDVGEAVAIITTKTNFTDDWISSVLRSYSNVELQEEGDTIEKWYQMIIPFLNEVYRKEKLKLLTDNLSIPGDAKSYIKVFSYLHEYELDINFKINIAKNLNICREPIKIVQVYRDFINMDDIPIDVGGALFTQSFMQSDPKPDAWNWHDLVNEIKNKIKPNKNANTEQIKACIEIMLILCFKLKIDSALFLSKEQNFKDALFFKINIENDHYTKSLLILSSLLFNPENKKANNPDINNGFKIVNNFLKQPKDFSNIYNRVFKKIKNYYLLNNFLYISASYNGFNKLSSLIIKQLFDSEKNPDFVNLETLFNYFEQFLQAVDKEELLDHIRGLYSVEENLIRKVKDEIDTIPSGYQSHYYFFKACPEELREPYFKFLAEGLRNMGQDQWLKHLKDETELIKLVILIHQKGLELDLSIELRKALFEYSKKIYNGDIELLNTYLKTNWNSLLGSLMDEVKITLLNSIRDYIESDTNNEGSISKVDEIYHRAFIENDTFLKDSERFVRSVCSRVLENGDEDDITWLKNLIQTEAEIFDTAGAATENFKEEIKHVDPGTFSGKVPEIIREIAEILDVKIEEDPEENQAKEE